MSRILGRGARSGGAVHLHTRERNRPDVNMSAAKGGGGGGVTYSLPAGVVPDVSRILAAIGG